MNIPWITIVVLGVMAIILIIYRFNMGRAKGIRASCSYGAAMTIGSRQIQSDAYEILEQEEGIMAVLADGMGKGYGGKIASQIAVETVEELFENRHAFYHPQYYFGKAFRAANRQILDTLNGERGGASVAAILIQKRKLYYGLVGGVKLAVYRKGELIPITSGHTIGVLAQERYREGKLTRQEAIKLLEEQRLYNYLGQEEFREIEFFDLPVNLYGGEYVVLLSDGLYEGIPWRELEECLGKPTSCKEKALEMVEKINNKIQEEVGNASVVIVKVN